jgi:Yip1 domain
MLEPTPVTPTTLSAGGNKGLIDRVRDLLMKPKEEWVVIDAEPATVSGLFTSYVMILSAIPAIFTALGLFLFVPRSAVAIGGISISYGLTTTSIIVSAVVQYILGLVSVYIIALIIDGLAPTFGGTKDQLKSMKVAAYYPTAMWVACLLLIIPGIGLLGMLIGAIYSLYLLYLGLPILMKVPAEKLLGYFIAVLVVALVVLGVINMISTRIVYGGMF